jgi:hypothetical protein
MKNTASMPRVRQDAQVYDFDIRQFPGYVGKMPMEEIILKIEGKSPYTYAISDTESSTIYMLSFIRGDGDQGLVHIQFSQLEDGTWGYRNGHCSIDPDFPNLLRKMMHISWMLQPIPLQ